jgi:hypothetical protein
MFLPFSLRYSQVARVDMNYKIESEPGTPEEELQKIKEYSVLADTFYPAEIAEFNGLVSRYWNSDYTAHAKAIYLDALNYYPDYFEFYLFLYQLAEDEEEAKAYLAKARQLMVDYEMSTEDGPLILDEIDQEMVARGWN